MGTTADFILTIYRLKGLQICVVLGVKGRESVARCEMKFIPLHARWNDSSFWV